jgi:hypothetical protein
VYEHAETVAREPRRVAGCLASYIAGHKNTSLCF